MNLMTVLIIDKIINSYSRETIVSAKKLIIYPLVLIGIFGVYGFATGQDIDMLLETSAAEVQKIFNGDYHCHERTVSTTINWD
jgi:hypothetical protein